MVLVDRLLRIKKFKGTRDIKDIYKNELGKVCFAHDAACCDSKNLAKITISDKVLKHRAYEIVINAKYGGYQKGFASISILTRKQDWK